MFHSIDCSTHRDWFWRGHREASNTQELVLGVRSSAWAKGMPLGEQFVKIASHGFKYVNVIFGPD